MSYVALYRKYRPKNFEEIVGQKAIVTTLKNQLSSGKIGHAYLFCGMRGTGKTSTARVFAKALNCEKGPTENPCNECVYCKAIDDDNLMDVIEMDAASNRGIDDIRDLREKVNFAPSEGRYKIYIIDEVHMLTTEAFNALLKTLEEPPSYVVFILATTEPNKLLPTILSRCMRFDFTRITIQEIVGRLKEVVKDLGIEVEEKALTQIASHSQGSARDALGLLDKAMAFEKGKLRYEDVLALLGAVSHKVFYDISTAIMQSDTRAVLNVVDQLVQQGKDLFRFMDDLLEHFRNLLMACINADRNLIDITDEDYARLQDISKGYTKEKLLSIIDILKEAANDVKWSSQPRIIIEAALTKLTLPALWEMEEGYVARLQQLEQQMLDIQGQIQSMNISYASPKTNESTDKDTSNFIPTQDVQPIEAVDKNNFSPQTFGKPFEEPKSESPSVQTHENTLNMLENIQKSWPKVLEYLGKKRKMTLVSFINAGDIKPAKIEKNNLYLLNNGDTVYEEKVLAEKHTIEKIIKQVSGTDITLKGFTTEHTSSLEQGFGPSGNKPNDDVGSKVSLKGGQSDPDENKDKGKSMSDEEYGQKVIEFFGEENVTFVD